MSRRKTHQEFIVDFKARNPFSKTIEILGEYQGVKVPIRAACKTCGYEWDPTPGSLLSGCGCPSCSGNRKKTHEEFLLDFKKKSSFANAIKFQSEYKGAFEPITAECVNCGHVWFPLPTNLLKGDRGCPVCSGSGKGTGPHGKRSHEEFVKAFYFQNPHANDIELVGKYSLSSEPLEVRCKVCGHKWSPVPTSLLAGSGCPRCAGKGSADGGGRTHEEFLEDFSRQNPSSDSIEVLGKYTRAKDPIACRCLICGCEWSVNADRLLRGSGCPACTKRRRSLQKTKSHERFVEDFKKKNPYASTIEIVGEYSGDANPIDALCLVCGHGWSPRATHLLSHPTGCPNCAKTSTSFMEQYILIAFRRMLGEEEVLHRDRNKIGMELDILIPSLNVAIEPGSWKYHKSNIKRDAEKRNRGVRVITIYDSMDGEEDSPFSDDFYRYSIDLGAEPGHLNLRSLVETLAKEVGVACLLGDQEWSAIEEEAYRASVRRTHDEYIRILKRRNTKYASGYFEVTGRYKSDKHRIKCRCTHCGHEWSPMASNLLTGQGCPKCAGTMKLSHEEFLSKLHLQNPHWKQIEIIGTYQGNSEPVACRCKECGFEWSPTAHDLLGSVGRPGHGCPRCAKKRRAASKTKTHEQFLEELSLKNPNAGNIRIIGRYSKATEPIDVECLVCGNLWSPTPSQLLSNKSGCPECAKHSLSERFRKTRDEYEREALAKHDGKIELLGKYQGDGKAITCKCLKCGHVWSPIAGNILRGQGCPECGKAARSAKRMKMIRCVETGEIYMGLKAAARACGLKDGGAISNAVRDKTRSAGFHWEYIEDD